MFDLTKRSELEAKWNPQEKPVVLFSNYVVYKYDFSGWMLVGSNDAGIAQSVRDQFKKQPHCEFAEVTNSYPYEITVNWKDKDKKKK